MRWMMVTMVAVVLAGCGGASSTDPTTTSTSSTTAPTTESTAPLPEPPVTAPETTLARPTAPEGLRLDLVIEGIYPDVPAGQASALAVDTCAEILSGLEPQALVQNTIERYSGRLRPDATPEQAQGIIDAVRQSDFCQAGAEGAP